MKKNTYVAKVAIRDGNNLRVHSCETTANSFGEAEEQIVEAQKNQNDAAILSIEIEPETREF